MAENRRDKRFFFTRGQFVLLGVGFTLASIIIFFFGMIVGKGIEARKIIKAEEPVAKIPIKPSGQGSAEAPAAQAKEEITFYDTLAKDRGAEPPGEEKAKDATPAEKMGKSEVKAITPQTKPVATPAPPNAVVAKATPAADTSRPAAVLETAESKESGSPWTVQVNAYPDERSANLLVDRLKNKGYNAHVTEVRNKGKIWYRVRVGRYESKEEAKKIEETLRNREDFAKAFATSR